MKLFYICLLSVLVVQLVVCSNEVEIESKEKKSGVTSTENRRSVTDTFSYVGGLEGIAYLISSSKFVAVQRSVDYLYKIVYSHTTSKTGDKITFTVGDLDKSLTLFHFSSDFVSELDEKCKIDSKLNYNYTQITDAKQCDDIKTKVANIINSISKPDSITNNILTLKSSDEVELSTLLSEGELNYKIENTLYPSQSVTPYIFYSYKTKIEIDKVNVTNSEDGSTSIVTVTRNIYDLMMEHQKYSILKKTSSISDVIEFTYTSTPFIFVNNDGRTYTEATSDYSQAVYYYCLNSDCKYICEMYNDVNNPTEWTNSLVNKCYEVTSRAVSVPLFNKAYEDISKEVKTSVSSNNERILKISNNYINNVLKEDDYDNKNVKASNGKGYYYEDIKQTINSNDLGYYKGYFLLNNKLTIIEHTGATRQEKVSQIKLVKELNSETHSFAINDVDDFDDESCGIEVAAGEGNCTGFVTFDKITECDINIDNYLNNYIGYMFNVSEDKTSLIITNIDDRKNIKNIYLKEIDESEISGIISRISKDVLPISEKSKCINVKVNETVTLGYDYKDKNEWISNGIIIDDQKFYKKMSFILENINCLSCQESYFESGSGKYYYQYSVNDVKYYKSDNNPFYRSFYELKGEDFVDCENDYKTKGIKHFDDNLETIRKLLPTNSSSSGKDEEDGKQNNESNCYGIVFSLIILTFLLLF